MSETSIGRGVVTIGADTSSLASEVSSGVADQAGAISSAFGGLGKAAGAAFAAAAAIGIAAAAGLAKLGSSFDDAYDSLRVQTGKTGDALAGLQDDFRAVVSSVPADFGDASTAIGTLSQKLGLTGAPLQALSEQVLNLSRITKTDLGANVKATADLFGSWGTAAADQGPKLDELFRISQQTGVSVGDLAQQMTDGGVQFREAGLTFESTGALLGLLGKKRLSASDVLPALNKAMAQAAKDGKDAGTVFQDTFAAIKNAPDDTKAAGIALDVFGAKAGPKFAALIREGKLSYEDLAATIAAGGDTISQASDDTADWSEKLKLLTNKALLFLEPIATKVFNAIGRAVEWVTPYVQKITAWLGTHLPVAIAVVRTWIVDHLVPAFRAVASWIVDHWPQISAVFVAVWDGIKKAAMFVIDTVVPAVIAGFKWVVDWVVDHWDQISAVVVAVFDAVKKAVLYVVTEVLPKIASGLKTAFKWLIDNKEVLIGVAAALAVGLTALFVSWAAGAASAAAATIAAAAPFIAIGLAIAGVVAGVLYAYNHFKTFHDIVDAVASFFRDTLWPILQNVFGWLRDNVPPIIGGIIDVATFLWQNVLSPLVDFIAGYFKVQFEAARIAFEVIKTAVEGVTTAVTWLWDNVLSPYVDFLKGAFSVYMAVVRVEFDVVKIAVDAVVTAATWLWHNVLEPIGSFLQGYFSVAMAAAKIYFEVWKTAIEGVVTAVGWLWDNVLSPFVGFVQGTFAVGMAVAKVHFEIIKVAVDLLIGTVTWLWHNILEPFIGYIAAGFSTGMDVGRVVWDGITSAVGYVSNAATGLWHYVLEPFISFLGAAFTTGMDVGKKIWDGLTTAVGAVSTAAKSLWHDALEPIVGFFKGAFDEGWKAAKTAIGYVTEPLKSVISFIQSIIDKATEAYNALASLNPFKDDVKGTYTGSGSSGGGGGVGHNAAGTNFWGGGPTWLNENGGEILTNLPRGTTVFPHDVSVEGYAKYLADITAGPAPQFPSVMRLVLEDGRELRGYVEEVADSQVTSREQQLVGALQAGQRR